MTSIRLGRTDLDVSPIALGTWGLGGGWGSVTDDAIAAIRRAWECGINFFDTAHAYGHGASEAAIGQILAGEIQHQRDDLVLLTKGGVEGDGRGGFIRNSDAEFLEAALHRGLQALGTDHVDIYLIHWPDPTIEIERTAEVANSFVERGLVRYVGTSNFSVKQMERFGSVAPLDVVQLPYSLFGRRIDDEQLAYCRTRGIPVLGYQPYAGGLLTGAITRQSVFAPDDWRSRAPEYRGKDFELLMSAVDRLRDIATEIGCEMAQMALAWVLARPGRVIPVTGAEQPHLVDSTVEALSIDLTEDQIARIDDAVRDAQVIGIKDGPAPRSNIPV